MLPPNDVTLGIYPLKETEPALDAALFYARQCALDAGRDGLDCKTCGREQCRICQKERQLLADVRRALDQGEFQLWIQFFVDARTFRVVGGEALSRWNHPGQGLLHPSQFVPLLEREGRISQLDLSAMERACTFLERLENGRRGTSSSPATSPAGHLLMPDLCGPAGRSWGAMHSPESC